MKVYLLLCAVVVAVATTANGWPVIYPDDDGQLQPLLHDGRIASPVVDGQGKRDPLSPIVNGQGKRDALSPIVNGKRSPVLRGGAYSPSSDGQAGKTEVLGRVAIPKVETEAYKDGVRVPSLALGSLGKKPESSAQSRCVIDPIC